MANPTSTATPVSAAELQTWLASELPHLIEKYGVPGAQAGVLTGGQILTEAAGILHLGTGVEATTDALFQIGSITKVWTTSLVMQLVDDGLLDLDVPIRTYLPEFAIADEQAAAIITTRHLLSHQAGFEGDLFTDTGRGDDCVQKDVATLADAPQLFTPGTRFSYNNAGFVVLGRLIEVLRGAPYEQVLVERLIAPLGLTHAAPGPYEAIQHRVAQGHIAAGEDGALVPAPIWSLVRSNAPAGASLSMRVADLLTFAKMHVDGGLAADGTRVLSEASTSAMQVKQVDVPFMGLLGEAWGLGWELDETPVGPMISHDGSTIGQNAFLRVIPELGIAVAVLTNGGDVYAISRAIYEAVFGKLTGTTVLAPLPVPVDPDAVVDEATAAPFLGTYSASVMDVVVSRDDDGVLWVAPSLKGELAELQPPEPPERVVPYSEHGLIQVEGNAGIHVVYAFVDADADGRHAFIFTSRALPRSA